MEPAVKPAAAATRSGVVGVLATTGTLQSAKFAALLDRFASDVRVIAALPGLVELIETGDLHSEALVTLLRGYVEQLLAAGCDTIILGCTHYPFLKPSAQSDAPTLDLPDRYRCRRGPATATLAPRTWSVIQWPGPRHAVLDQRFT